MIFLMSIYFAFRTSAIAFVRGYTGSKELLAKGHKELDVLVIVGPGVAVGRVSDMIKEQQASIREAFGNNHLL